MNFFKIFDKQFCKFLLVGVINTVFGYTIMFSFYNLLDFGYWFSSFANYFFASILSYFLNKNFTFKSNGSIILFSINISICYLIAYGIAKPITLWMLSDFSNELTENIAMLLGSGLFVILNYLTQRFITFSFQNHISVDDDNLLPDGMSVVVPAYNEEKQIYMNILEISKAISCFCQDNYEIIAVNDGSCDDTYVELYRASKKDSHIVVINSQPNRGKGFAVRTGANVAKYRYTAFCDADLDLHPRQLEFYLEKAKKENCVGVIASKLHKQSHVEYPFVRKIITYTYYIILKLFFDLNLKDTQTGLKLYKTQPLKCILPLLKIDRFAYDIEILAILKTYDCKIISAPCDINFSRGIDGSRIKLRDIFNSAKDTLRVFFYLYVKKIYEIK